MAITTEDLWIAAPKQRINLAKTGSQTATAFMPTSTFDSAGPVGAGTLAGSSTTAGVVPTDATAGFPLVNAFGGGAKGYLGGLKYKSSVAASAELHDMLWKGGAYPFNANVTLSSQPSFSSRVPGGTDYTGTQIWIEVVTAFTGNLSVTITYTNQNGTTGKSTGAFAPGVAPGIRRMFLVPLASGDSGVQKIESVIATTATVGTFNVLVLRPLWMGRCNFSNSMVAEDFLATGMPEVFADSAFFGFQQPDSTATGIWQMYFDVVNG